MRRRLTLLGLLWLGLVIPSLSMRAAQDTPAPLPLVTYIDRLDTMRTLLDERRLADAQKIAYVLRQGVRVQAPGGTFEADPSLLDAVIENRVGAAGQLAIAVNELRKNVPAATTAGNTRMLERLRLDEEASKIKAGGEVSQPPISTEPLLERMVDKMEKVLEWIAGALVTMWDWLMELWPKQKTGAGSAIKTRLVVGALALVIVTVIGILVWEVMRRSRRNIPAPVTGSEPIASSQDADPLSRGASEWERYAAQLAAAGRVREAIRAWYHAVLVTCYGAGILHYRKGRTNWEYVGAISPELAWRGDFITLTRTFETEWYGHTTSTQETLESCAERAERILHGLRRGMAAA